MIFMQDQVCLSSNCVYMHAYLQWIGVSIQEHYNTIHHTLYKYQTTYIQVLPPLQDMHDCYYMYIIPYELKLISQSFTFLPPSLAQSAASSPIERGHPH